MSLDNEVAELRKRRELAAQTGGEEGIARQHERGKLTVRERIDAISDPGCFQRRKSPLAEKKVPIKNPFPRDCVKSF